MENMLKPFILSHNQAFLGKQFEKFPETRMSELWDPDAGRWEIRMSRNCDRDVGLLFCLVWRNFILCFSIRGNISFL